jgi:hypothetical protein
MKTSTVIEPTEAVLVPAFAEINHEEWQCTVALLALRPPHAQAADKLAFPSANPCAAKKRGNTSPSVTQVPRLPEREKNARHHMC